MNNNIINPRNQIALLLYFFRVYLKCKIKIIYINIGPLMLLNALFILIEILAG
jgi:hypothetical protein